MENTDNSKCLMVCIALGILAGLIMWYLADGIWLPILFAIIAAVCLHIIFCKGVMRKSGVDAAADTNSAAALSTTTNVADTPAMRIADVSSPTPVKAAEPVKAEPKAAAPKKTAAAKAKSAPAKKKTAAKKSGPERLKKPKGKADDLKQISGVGPKLEKTLNGLGFWHFEQIAKWKKADVAIVDDELSFKGRIERDDWIKQAKALAKSK